MIGLKKSLLCLVLSIGILPWLRGDDALKETEDIFKQNRSVDKCLPISEQTADIFGICHGSQIYEKCRKMGFAWQRGGMVSGHRVDDVKKLLKQEKWDYNENLKKVYNAGGKVLGGLFFNDKKNEWANDKEEKYLPLVDQYVFRLVSKYKDRIKIWECMNEPDYFWAKGSPKQCANITITCAKAAKRADPDCLIFSPAPITPAYMESLLIHGIGDVVDGFAIHLYTSGKALDRELENYKKLFKKYNQDHKPIWITETGYASRIAPENNPELEKKKYFRETEIQAELAVKNSIQALAHGIKKIFWYQSTDVANVYTGENFGMLWSIPYGNRGINKFGKNWVLKGKPFSLKPDAVAFNTFLAVADKMSGIKKIEIGDDITAYWINFKTKSPIVVAWSENPMEFNFPASGDKMATTSMYCHKKELAAEEGFATININRYPVYIDGVSIPKLEVKSCLIALPEKLEIYSDVKNTTPVTLTNKTNQDFSGTITWYGSPGISVIPKRMNIKLPAGKKIKKDLIISSITGLPLGKYKLTSKLDRGGPSPSISKRKTLVLASPIQAKIGIILQNDKPKLAIDLLSLFPTLTKGRIICETPDVALTNSPEIELSPGKTVRLIAEVGAVKTPTDLQLKFIQQANKEKTYELKLPFAIQPCLRKDKANYSEKPWNNLTGKKYFVQCNPNGKFDGNQDIGAQFYTQWDDQKLYLTVKTRDNKHFQPNAGFNRSWNGDSVQIALDIGNEKHGSYDNNDFEILLANGTKGDFCAFTAAPLYGSGPIPEGEFKTEKIENGMLYSFSIPWKILGIQKIAAGKEIGFSFLVNDNDNDGQGRNWIEWTKGIGKHKDTTKYGTLVLVK